MAENFAQNVKAQVDIVKVIGEYVKLRKTGGQNFTGLCPFHQEKTGSFSVNAAHGYYYCFGCHEKGDVFNFVMKLEGLSFPEAVRAVAGKAGIALPRREFGSAEEAKDAGLRKQVMDLHEAATQYFEAMLKTPGAAGAREYLTGRGVGAETVAKFRIGFAPDDFNDMRERLKAHFNEEALRASGLFNSSEKDNEGAPTGPLYARFRKRITFPITNESGRTIAFTARALDAVDDKGRPLAKYMNSPETLLYSKGQVLFNLANAKAEMRTFDFAVLVEGQMDCISVFMAGIRNVVATSGTAFTEAQVRLMGRFTRNVVVNFDPDQAGQTAAAKSIELLTQEGFAVKVLTLEGGLDPDRFVREQGVQAYMAALRGARRHQEYLIERARELFPQRTAEAKVKAMNFLLPHIRRMPNAMARTDFADDAAQKLGIDSAVLRQEMRQAASQRLESVRSYRPEPATEVERVLLRALVRPAGDAARERAVSGLEERPEWYEGLGAAGLVGALVHGDAPGNPLDAAPDEGSRATLAEVLGSAEDEDAAAAVERVEDALHTLAFQHLERRQREIRTAMAEAERRGDQAAVDGLLGEKMRVDRALREH